MSDASQGSGWKQASDGKWYPAGPAIEVPETTVEPSAPSPPTRPEPAAKARSSKLRVPKLRRDPAPEPRHAAKKTAAAVLEAPTAPPPSPPPTPPPIAAPPPVPVVEPPPPVPVVELPAPVVEPPPPAPVVEPTPTPVFETPPAPVVEPATAYVAAPLPLLPPLPEMVPGTEPKPGPGWKRGVDTNWYPPRPPRVRVGSMYDERPAPPPPKRIGVGGLLAIVGVLAIVTALIVGIVAIVQSQTSNDPRRPALPHNVGDTAQTGDLAVTIDRATDPYVPSNPFEAAPVGEHLVSMDITVRNIRTDREFTILSVTMFDLTDSKGVVQKLTISNDLAMIDGVVPADEARRGFLLYRVTDTATTPLTLRVRSDSTAGGITFTIP